ncbi:MAG: smc 7 [Capsulimonas sp.]|nr:smc 7 [Capsulimonas sp.]
MIDNPTRPADLNALKSTLRRAAAEARSTQIRTAFYRLAWQWMTVLAALFVLDLVFGLPVWLRWVALAGQVAFLAWKIKSILDLSSRLGYSDEWAARILEERHPEVDNAFINAIQFEHALSNAPADQAPLMEREVRRGETATAGLGKIEGADRTAERSAARTMAILGVAWALVALLFSGGFLAVAPRLFAPWMDDVTPPYSVTHFEVKPKGATVRYGESLFVSVKISGQTPDTVSLMTSAHGAEWQKIALESGEPGVYSVTLDSLRENTRFYVQANTGRSARYLITVAKPPTITGLQVSYVYPAYTAHPPMKETVGPNGIHGLAGTTATFQITSNRPLSGGLLTLKTDIPGGDQQIAVQPDSKNKQQASVQMTITRSGEYRLSLTAEDGQISPEAAKGKITLDKDARPNVWITTPTQDILVTPKMKVPVGIDAEDDQGVQSVQLHRLINDLADSPRSYPEVPVKRATHELTIDLADLGVRPGDKITYYATAYDNNPGKPNIGETETYTMKVVSQEEFNEALKQERTPADLNKDTDDIVSAVKDLADQQQQLAQKMQDLQKQLEKKPGDPGLQKQMAEAKKEQQDLQKRAQQMAKAMREFSQSPSPTDFERALKKKIGEIAQKVGDAANGPMQNAQSGSPAQAAKSAEDAAKQLAKANDQMQGQAQVAVQHMMEIQPLYNDTQRFMDLLNRQGQLVLKAREFQQSSGNDVESKTKLDALHVEQADIQRELTQLQKDFREHAETAQAHFPKAADTARKIADEIDRRKIADLMKNAGDNFQQWNGPVGFENAQNALQQLQAMVKKAGACQSQAKGELDISLAQSLGQSGLGKSLDQFGSGQGNGQGQNGMGFGAGGMQSGPGGKSGGGYTVRGPKAYMPSTQTMTGTGGMKKMRHANHLGTGSAPLSPSDVEVMKNPSQKPAKAGDHDPNRYPPEYRKMISDYFKSVADGQ